jgi:hypothetical protein
VRLVVTTATAKYTDSAVKSLQRSGFDKEDVEIVSCRGVSLGIDDSVVSKRKLKKTAVEHCSPVGVQSQLFASAITGLSGSFVANYDAVLVLTPDVILWPELRRFLEATLEPRYMAVYFPQTSERFFLERDTPIPMRKYGWYKFNCNEPISGATCFVMNVHTAVVLSALVEGDVKTAAAEWSDTAWEYLFYKTMVRSGIDCYAAGISFAYSINNDYERERCVQMQAKLKDGFENRNWYLN